MSEAWLFLREVVTKTAGAMASGVSFVAAGILAAIGWSSWLAAVVIGILAIFYAFFEAWRSKHRKVLELEERLAKRLSIVGVPSFRGGRVSGHWSIMVKSLTDRDLPFGVQIESFTPALAGAPSTYTLRIVNQRNGGYGTLPGNSEISVDVFRVSHDQLSLAGFHDDALTPQWAEIPTGEYALVIVAHAEHGSSDRKEYRLKVEPGEKTMFWPA